MDARPETRRCPPFKLWLEKCVVGGYKLQWPAIRQAVVEAYDGIMQAFNYYGCQGTGSPFALSLKEYRAFLGDLGIVDEENPCLCRARCLSHFKVYAATTSAGF